MSKRKLTKQQMLRIKTAHGSHIHRAAEPATDSLDEENALGPEQEGLLISRFGKSAMVEDSQGQVIHCHIRQNLSHVVTGDNVIFREGQEGKGVIVASLPRKTLLARPDRSGQLKPLAANLTQMVIVFAPTPEPSHDIISRYLVAAELLGLKPLLVLNKTDLLTEANPLVEEILSVYSSIGYPLIQTYEGKDLSALQEALVHHTSIFLGQSGVGKSSLVRGLLPDEMAIRVGEISETKGLGKHTTTVVQLFHFPQGGNLIDSPGVRRFNLWPISFEELFQGFKEFRPFYGQCKYRDCLHEMDANCAIHEAVKKGLIHPARLHTFLEMKNGMTEK